MSIQNIKKLLSSVRLPVRTQGQDPKNTLFSVSMHPKLGTRDLHIWQADINITPAQAESAHLILSNAEKDRAQKFKFETHRSKFIAARSTLRKILSYYLSIQPESICFTENQHGKPMLDPTQHPQDIFFNLSHAHNIALYAISPLENIGIDIEFVDRKVDFDAIAARFFSDKESQHIHSLTTETEKATDFFKIWTGKEAFIKAVGEGLSFPLKEFEISLKGGKVFLESIYGDADQASVWSLFQLDVPDNYQACACVQSEMPMLTLMEMASI